LGGALQSNKVVLISLKGGPRSLIIHFGVWQLKLFFVAEMGTSPSLDFFQVSSIEFNPLFSDIILSNLKPASALLLILPASRPR